MLNFCVPNKLSGLRKYVFLGISFRVVAAIGDLIGEFKGKNAVYRVLSEPGNGSLGTRNG